MNHPNPATDLNRTEMIPKKQRGGKRQNAGRKATGVTRCKLSVTVSPGADANIRRIAMLRGTTVSDVADGLFRRARK